MSTTKYGAINNKNTLIIKFVQYQTSNMAVVFDL
jgi:hypothetical protein